MNHKDSLFQFKMVKKYIGRKIKKNQNFALLLYILKFIYWNLLIYIEIQYMSNNCAMCICNYTLSYKQHVSNYIHLSFTGSSSYKLLRQEWNLLCSPQVLTYCAFRDALQRAYYRNIITLKSYLICLVTMVISVRTTFRTKAITEQHFLSVLSSLNYR